MTIAPDQLPDDAQALKRIITAMAQDAVAAQAEIAKLRFQLARYRRAEYGRSSEKLARETDQLELAIEALETAHTAGRTLAEALTEAAAAAEAGAEATRPLRSKFGRAAWMQDRTVGVRDAGASVVALVMKSLAEYAQG